MYILKGFFEYPTLADNSKDVISILGELSSNSRTYAKDKTIHSDLTKPGVVFTSFYSVRGESLASIGMEYESLILSVGAFIYSQSKAGTINGNPTTFRRLLLADFNLDISELSSGRMLFNGSIWMPEWIEFSYSRAGEHNRIKIWLSDESFSGQYDEYEIEVIHPILPFDDFFKNPILVRDRLLAYDFVKKLEESQALRKEYPYTHLKAFSFEYSPPGKPNLNTKAHWIVIVYGENGNVADTIKETIYREILADTTRTKEAWEEILPDLFETASEFMFVPFWSQYAVPQSDQRAGIYSPTVDPRKQLALIRNAIKGNSYTSNYVSSNYELSTNIYKSLAFGVVGSPRNHSGSSSFAKLMKDYIIVTNTSPDINRIHPDTSEWMALFSALLLAAEEMTKFTSVPQGISRIVRDDIVYASAYYKNINYLVTSKASVEELEMLP